MPLHPILSRISNRLYNRFVQLFPPPTWVDLGYFALYSINFGCLLHLIRELGGSTEKTEGPSMLPTIAVKGDSVYVDRTYRRGRGVRVGDLVDFRHPMFHEVGVIKRVLGMPGDFVMRDTPKVDGRDRNEKGRGMMIQIPEGHFWVVGDNVEASRDSRYYGPLPLALIKGKVTARVRPLRNMGWIENTLQRPEDEV